MHTVAAGRARRRVLFVAESVTAAQIVRLLALAEQLDPARFEVHFASGRFPETVFSGCRFIQHRIETLSPACVERALEAGRRLYDRRALTRYVQAELELLRRVQPELCVGDFRWSLSTSAEHFGVPCLTLINAYWSPHAVPERWPVPDLRLLRWLGDKRAEKPFAMALPFVLRRFAAPLNSVRRRLGMPPVGSLREVLCHGTRTLYPDHPRLTLVRGAPSSHRFLGPVAWQPRVSMPALRGDPKLPLVYVTLGSSGRLSALGPLLEGLRGLPVRVLLATAGRPLPSGFSCCGTWTVCDYVPGSAAARAAQLVVSNGGSTTGYQALAEGTPVLGLPSNLDQFLASAAIVDFGAGLEVKARAASPEAVARAVARGLEDPSVAAAAREAQRCFAATDSGQSFRSVVEEVLCGGPPGPTG